MRASGPRLLPASAGMWDGLPAWQGQAADRREHLGQNRGEIKGCFVSAGDGFAFPQWLLGSPRYSVLFSLCMRNVVGIDGKGMRGAR